MTGRGSLLRVHVPDPAALWWSLWSEGLLISVNGLLCLRRPWTRETIEAVADAFARVAPNFDIINDDAAAAAIQE